MWLKWSFAPAPFTPNYVLGFIITAVMIGTIALWLMSGCKGWRNLIASTWHIAFCVCLIFLTLWAFLSQFWAFGLDDYPGLAQTASLQLLIVMLFTFVVIAASPPIDFVIPVLIVSMLIHGSIGGLQVIFQSDIGLDILGEFSLDVAESGVSVLESNGERWLRPYGLLPHPNVLAGIIAFGILASAAWILESGKKYGFGIMSFVIGFWFLMLTFSRSAWIGFLAGVIFAFPFVSGVFITRNFVAITKNNTIAWDMIHSEVRMYITEFLQSNKVVVQKIPELQTREIEAESQEEKIQIDITPEINTELDKMIVTILDEYVTPAVESDGGAIHFKKFDEESGQVTVILKGACSGCPSSTATLKGGIETLLKSHFPEVQEVVALEG